MRRTARLTNTTQKDIATKSDIDIRNIDVMIFGNERRHS